LVPSKFLQRGRDLCSGFQPDQRWDGRRRLLGPRWRIHHWNAAGQTLPCPPAPLALRLLVAEPALARIPPRFERARLALAAAASTPLAF